MQMLHGRRAEDDEETHPEGGPLEGDGFIRFLFVGFVLGSKDNGVKKQCEEAQNEKKFNHEDHEVLGVVFHPVAALGNQDLIDIMKVYAAGEQQDDQ